METYLESRETFDEINLMLFNHGVEAVGFPQVEEWRKRVLSKARKRGQFVGLDEKRYPRDFGALGRYQKAIQQIPSRYPLPGALRLSAFFEFAKANQKTHQVKIIKERA